MKTIFLESHHIKNLTFGFGQFNFHLLKALHKIRDPELEYIVHGSNPSYLRSEIGNNFKYKRYFSFRRYESFRIRKKYDLWHAMNQNTMIYPYHDTPILLTVHDHPNVKDPANYKELADHRAFQEKLNRSAAITYISNFTKEATHKLYDIPKVPEFVIVNGNPISDTAVDLNFKPKYVPKKPFFFTIGVMDPRKNFIHLVKMMPFLPEMELVIAGKDTSESAAAIRALIKELKLDDRVHLPGKITEKEKYYYYKNCSAFMFPSRREGFGLPVVEAMRFGKPVFLSDKSCLPEIGGPVANYWNNLDSKYMADVVTQGLETHLSNESELAAKLVARSQLFSWDIAAAEYQKVYKSLV